MLITLVIYRLGQEDCRKFDVTIGYNSEFKAILGHTMKPCLNTKREKKKRKEESTHELTLKLKQMREPSLKVIHLCHQLQAPGHLADE